MKQMFSTNQVRIKKESRYKKIQNLVEKRVDVKSINLLFEESGLGISALRYQLFRYLLFIIWLFSLMILSQVSKGMSVNTHLIFILILFLISAPKISIFNRRTPFKILLDLIIENFKYKKNLEINRAVTQLKNLAIIKQVKPPSSDFILEQLRKFTKTTRPIFNRMISLWSMGKREEACSYFEQAINTKEGGNLARLFLKLDYMNPIELKNQLSIAQEMTKKERETQKLKRNQYRSYIIYAVVSISIIVSLVNFLTLAFFIDFLNELKII